MRKGWMVAAGLVLTACAAQQTALSPAPNDPSQRYQASAMVLENAEHGPELCLGAVGMSHPPQCGGVRLEGWDWDTVDDEDRVGGTIYGVYHVIGTYDGTTFTLTQPPGPPVQNESKVTRFGSPCPEPAGGWDRPRPEDTKPEDLEAAQTAASAQPDFAGLWLDDPNPPSGEDVQYLAGVILNVAFTGDLERHEAELRRHWGGALCVSRLARSVAELERISRDAMDTVSDRGLSMLTADPDQQTGRVEIQVVFFTADDQAAMDAKYGEGVVVLSAALQPVS